MKKDKKTEEEFLRCYDQYADAIFRYCYYRVFNKEKAEDLTQEAYLKTWRYLQQGKTIDNLRAFLYRTAGNLIIDESRKHREVSLNRIMEKGFSPMMDPRGDIELRLAGQEALKIIQSLDDKYRDVIIMKYVEDLSVREIAQILGETENNVYVRISRGFEKIRQMDSVKKAALTLHPARP